MQAQLKLPQIIPSTESHRLKYKVPEEGGVLAQKLQQCRKEERKNCQGGEGWGGFHTHEPPLGGRKERTQGGVRGYKASRGPYRFVAEILGLFSMTLLVGPVSSYMISFPYST